MKHLKKRVTLITGHFGSGKTEFAVNCVMDLKKEYEKVAIIDLDIANPYFRSREKQKMLEDRGIDIHYNSFGYDIGADLPALSAAIKTPLENEDYMVVVDVGGDDSGARVLNQFREFFIKDDCEMLGVINANRPETDHIDGAIQHLGRIQAETGLKVDAMVNNTHLTAETSPSDIIKGYRLCKEIEKNTGLELRVTTCRRDLLDALEKENEKEEIKDMDIYPIELYMRPSWLG